MKISVITVCYNSARTLERSLRSVVGWRSKILLNREVLRACRENGLRTNVLKILSKYPAKLLELFHRE